MPPAVPSATAMTPPARSEPRRKAACPCGSGKKYKRCCGGAAAAPISNSVLPREPASTLFQQAIACQRQGDVERARELYERVLALQPQHAGALHLLGTLALQRGAVTLACQLISQSIALNPELAQAHSDLGNVLCTAGKLNDAIASYDRAIALNPQLCEGRFNKSVALQKAHRHTEALDSCEQALALQPSLVLALYNRAFLLSILERPQEALAAYDQCLQAAPQHVQALSNRGVILLDLGRAQAALEDFDRSLALAPDSAMIHNNRGNALRRLSRLEEALASFDRALELDGSFFEAVLNRGTTLRQLGSLEAALASIDSALRLQPTSPEALKARAEVLFDLGRHTDASACLAEMLAIDPEAADARGVRLHLLSAVCDWRSHAREIESLIAAVNAGRRSSPPFPLLALSDSAAAQLHCARTFVRECFPAADPPTWQGERYEHDRIRVAYLSGDLRNHPVSTLLARIIELHDRERFEALALSLRPRDSSPLGQRMQVAFDDFIDVAGRSTDQIATLIREREVDILVDLMGFTGGSRFDIVARRAAPIQVSFLGYPGTTGAPYVDYLLADDFVIPPALAPHYAESIVWLPDCFQPNDDRREQPSAAPARSELSLPADAFVFCSFNNNYKFNPEGFDVWMRILRAAPAGVLWLMADNEQVIANVHVEASRRGVDPARLVFAERVSYSEHLARLRSADLFLDTLPFNAGATASDALWTGLPLLTCVGEAFAARMAGSLLRTMGLPELITSSAAEYEAAAIALATTPSLLAQLRARLERARAASPLFNSERFCRHLEQAYTEMHRRSQAGEPAAGFAVP